MITHLHSCCDIGTTGNELINDKVLIGFCHDAECMMFHYFETLQDRMVSKILSKYFIELKNVIPYELILCNSCFTTIYYFTKKVRTKNRNTISPTKGKDCLLGAYILLGK